MRMVGSKEQNDLEFASKFADEGDVQSIQKVRVWQGCDSGTISHS